MRPKRSLRSRLAREITGREPGNKVPEEIRLVLIWMEPAMVVERQRTISDTSVWVEPHCMNKKDLVNRKHAVAEQDESTTAPQLNER
jgi:hypothetical protein